MYLEAITMNLSFDYWEKRANKVLSNFDYKFPDEIDITDICWRYGIVIKSLEKPFYDGDITPYTKAFSIPKEGRRGTIYIRPGLDPIEKKILLAEEFCHLYSHCVNQLNTNEYWLNKTENQARRMAAYLLMPQKFLNTVYLAADEEPIWISNIADYFLVTEEFAQYRLELIFKRKIDGIGSINGKIGHIKWL